MPSKLGLDDGAAWAGPEAVEELEKMRELERENEMLRADASRLDWLADPSNSIGNVQLPTHCVTANLGSLRDAIDMAMREQEHGNA